MIIKPLVFALLWLFCFPLIAQPENLKVINKIVAQVGDEIILLNELEERRIQLIVMNGGKM